MFEVTHIRIAQTTDIHIDRAATRVQSVEEEPQAGIVSDSMMTSERKVIRVVYIMKRSFGVGAIIRAEFVKQDRRCPAPDKVDLASPDPIAAILACGGLQKVLNPRISGDRIWIQLQTESWLCRDAKHAVSIQLPAADRDVVDER